MLFAFVEYFTARQVAGIALPDVEFSLRDDDRLRPDVCVSLGEKRQNRDLDRVPIPGSPDLAVEVISPSERAGEMHDKVRRYLQCGTSEFWQIYRKSQTVQMHRGDIASIVEIVGFLTTDLLPGLRIPVASLFV